MPQSITIPLTRGQVAIVDADDLHLIEDYKWRAVRSGATTWYAAAYVRGTGRALKRDVRMHQLILPSPDGFVVDHINWDGLDNRRSNLRLVTQQQNAFNRGLMRTNTSGYIGVFYSAHSKAWIAIIRRDGKQLALGSYDTPEDAALARDHEVRQSHGEYARLNFPDADPSIPPPPRRTRNRNPERDSHGRFGRNGRDSE